jgi:hypothetical protein
MKPCELPIADCGFVVGAQLAAPVGVAGESASAEVPSIGKGNSGFFQGLENEILK